MPDQEQLVASIQLSPIATIVTDARQGDNPIVGVNDAFCELTGYAAHELVGHNCRILGGRGTEPEAKRILREAVAAGQPALAELTNYKKDGSPFCNAVMVAPVRSGSGEVTHFIGSQMQVREGTPSETSRRLKAVSLVETLSPRQSQVLALMTQGLRNREIADRLGIKEVTVKLHRSMLLKKLGAGTPADAVRIAMEAGLSY